MDHAQIEIEKLKHENYLLTMERNHRTAENEELAKKVEKIHLESLDKGYLSAIWASTRPWESTLCT